MTKKKGERRQSTSIALSEFERELAERLEEKLSREGLAEVFRLALIEMAKKHGVY